MDASALPQLSDWVISVGKDAGLLALGFLGKLFHGLARRRIAEENDTAEREDLERIRSQLDAHNELADSRHRDILRRQSDSEERIIDELRGLRRMVGNALAK